ncbi:MAG: TonB-dependent receptor [bacterium]
MNVKKVASCLGAGIAVVGLTGHASESTDEKPAPAKMEEVLVIAHPLSGAGLSQASTVLQGRELERKLAENIGATLAQEAGIHSAQFGNAVGRPVIHGLGGPRVRIMEDRIDALDVSVTSADHAVTVEPFIADRIEVLKGSSALLYGSGAIGGVVDVHTGRIPHNLADSAFSGGIESRYNDNTDGNATAAKLNGGFGQLAWHLDGTWKDGDDYDIPGFAESARLRAVEEAEEEGEEEDHEEEARGTVPGSAFDSESYAGGLSYIGEWGFVGASVSRTEAEYGLPGGHGHAHEEEHAHEDEHAHEEEEEEGNPLLDMQQTRTDFELGIKNPIANFTSFNLRLGINDYEHQEIEPGGEVGSEFTNKAWELRGEFTYENADWTGAFGVQHMDREFSAVGEEAFVPPVDTTDTGFFWVGERAFDNFSLETGLRVGKVSHNPSTGPDQDFTPFASSVGLVIPFAQGWTLGLVADYSSRAPVAEELYSNGPHLVTNAFEVGDPDLNSEKAANLAATLSYRDEIWDFSATTYYTRFSDFIYEQANGDIEDDLPVFVFQQEDATFAGIDVEVSARVAQWDNGGLLLRGMFDWVEAEVDVSGNDNLPRIPPLRFGVGVETTFGRVTASLDYLQVNRQRDVAQQELETSGYDDLRAYVGMDIPMADGSLNVFVNGRNLTDDEQRFHTSFIKDFAPAPGRTIEAGVRFLF